jgi:adenylate cyclase class 2
MQFEVEQKHRVLDLRALEERLAERGVQVGAAVSQADRYFAHPCRDFAQSDEALRIRTVAGKSFVTYKGPKIDTTTKTRREIELPLDAGDSDGLKLAELLQSLGFTQVLVVHKRRRSFEIDAEGRKVEGALDEIDGLGTFTELELITDEAGLDEANRVISTLGMELQLGGTERRSYLEMMLQKLGKLVSN